MADQSPASVNTYQLAKDLSDSANLIAAGFRAACAQWPKVVSLWLAGSAVAFAMRAIRLAGGAALKHSSLSTAWIGFHLLGVLGGTVVAGLMLRAFLFPGETWWRPDRGFPIYVALLMLASVIESALQLLPVNNGLAQGVAFLLLLPVLWIASQVLLYWVFCRLLLWPIGVLMGNFAVTPRRSWRLMRGYAGGYLGAVIAVNLPILLSSFVFAMVNFQHIRLGDPPSTLWLAVIAAVIGPAIQIMQQAMAAVLYQARVCETGPDLASPTKIRHAPGPIG